MRLYIYVLCCLIISFAYQSAMEAQTLQVRLDEYRPFILNAARASGVDEQLIVTICRIESQCDQSRLSPKRAIGAMQVMPATGAMYGIKDLRDTRSNFLAGALLLRDLLRKYPARMDLVLAGYNAGEGAIWKYGGVVPPYPETRGYVARGLKLLALHSTLPSRMKEKEPIAKDAEPERFSIAVDASENAITPPSGLPSHYSIAVP